MAAVDTAEFRTAARRVTDLLLSKRTSQGWWTGRLSTSALSTATAVMALHKAAAVTRDPNQRKRWQQLTGSGLNWLAGHQNPDGGWGDTVLSLSNISTTMLAHAVFRAAATDDASESARMLESSNAYIRKAGGVAAVIQRYGRDRTFSVPILTHCALAGMVDWRQVIPLPFELACIPHRWYAAVRMPVVSYALPALIAIGQAIFHHQGHWNPMVRWIRRRAIRPSLRVLESIQPENGGFLEATPLTSFVCMSLIACGHIEHIVTQRCLKFIEASVRDDGSWPIDSNLTTWVTTLSVNALPGQPAVGSRQSQFVPHPPVATDLSLTRSADVEASRFGPVRLDEGASLPRSSSGVQMARCLALEADIDRSGIREWLLKQQYRSVHPYTHAAPGGWSWTDLPGGVPDADDTPGALLAVMNLRAPGQTAAADEAEALRAGVVWLLDLQNRDGGWPTFCRGWGALPFDRSSCDLTAHALRAFHRWLEEPSGAFSDRLHDRVRRAMRRGLRYLERSQRPDGTWLPLWFGHQFNEDDQNPLYGTSRVVRALGTIGAHHSEAARRAIRWMLENQNDDGGWAARRGLESSVEETGLGLESLAGLGETDLACGRAAKWLAERVCDGRIEQPTPIGFYFAKLWYFEDLYPIIFAAAGLNRWSQALAESSHRS
jgi:squalene-hopene/tetraprenyl-beta-curcumene cyclase